MTNNGGPAFPEAGLTGLPNGEFIHGQAGMTLRDYFAAQAMQALISASFVAPQYNEDLYKRKKKTGIQLSDLVAVDAHAFADAMLRAREAL